MPFQKLNFKPGINRDQTNYSNEGGWYECDKIRFRSGFPEKIGGWVKTTTEYMLGFCRQMFGWITSYNDNFLACGTNEKVYIEVGSKFYDITPIREIFTTSTTPSTDNCITATQGSNVLSFYIPANGASNGDYVSISGVVGNTDPAVFAGIPVTEINNNYKVTVIDVDTFTITVPTAANLGSFWGSSTWGSGIWGLGGAASTLTGGGTDITLAFEITVGNGITTQGYGWGTGAWGGNFGWGLSSPDPVFLPQQDWWFDQFDNDLVMNIRNGSIYYWERGTNPTPDVALATRAFLLEDLAGASDVPDSAMQILVSQNDKHLLAFGCQPYASSPGDFDPLLIRWASQDDPGMWEPQVTNTSGFLRISRGSLIVRAIPTKQEILVFTEATLSSLQFTGTNDVFALQEIGDNLSIIGPRAVTVVNNMTFWMGKDKFYVYTGRVETLPCTLRNFVFNDINFNQANQIICGTNEGWNEVWWMYPSAQSNVNNRYVIYNHLERIWYYGNIERNAWLDSPLRNFPQASYTDATLERSYLLNHEDGTNDDGVALDAYIQSSDFDIAEGDQLMLTRRIIPDINFEGSSAANPEVNFIVRPRNFPGSTYQSNASNTQRVIQTTVNQFTDQVFLRARARQVALKIESTGLDTQWQLGSPRLDMRPDGKR
jgi:hypothetical protein